MSSTLPYQVDLTNCDREPIHQLGAIQPIGFMLVLSSDWMISRVSQNIGDFFDAVAADLIGSPIVDLFAVEAVHSLRNRLALLRGPDALCLGDHDFEAILDVSLWLKVLSRCRAFYSARPLSLFRAHGGQGGSDYLAPFLGTIEWGRLIEAAKSFGYLADQSVELEALGTFVRTASQIRPRVTDAGHLEMLDEAVARAGDRLASFATGRGGPEESRAT